MMSVLAITTVRDVSLGFYFVTGIIAILAIGWMAHRRLLGLGTRLLGVGVFLNASWELILFTVWSRRYDTILVTPIQALYQSLTEFGPLVLLVVLALDWAGYLSVERWREPAFARVHRVVLDGAIVTSVLWLAILCTLWIIAPRLFGEPIRVYRDLSIAYFIGTALLAVVVLGIAVRNHEREAIILFVVLGACNVLFEAIGLFTGTRSYDGLAQIGAVLIGFSEGGTAGALVWLVATRDSATKTPSMDRSDDRQSGTERQINPTRD